MQHKITVRTAMSTVKVEVHLLIFPPLKAVIVLILEGKLARSKRYVNHHFMNILVNIIRTGFFFIQFFSRKDDSRRHLI